MKKNDIDLSILGTDKDTAGRLADDFAVPEEGKERIFRQSLKKYRQGGMTDGDSVQGVERYRRPVWSRIAAAAAIVAVAAGGAGTGLLMLRGHNISSPDAETAEMTEADEVTEAATEEETEAQTEPPTEAPTEYLRELEILSSEKRVMTNEEHSQMVFAAMEDYQQNGPARLDRKKYTDKLRAAADSESLNTPELKSYIYDLMLNSSHYFSTVAGHHTFISAGNHIETDFGFDQYGGYSWEVSTNIDTGTTTEVYNCDGMLYNVDNSSMTYRKSYSSGSGQGMNLGTNDWMIVNPEGDNVSIIQPDTSHLGFGANTGFNPQLVQSHLNDLSGWQINGITEVNGRECAEVEGEWWKGHFKFYADIELGFLIMYDNSQGDHYELSDLRIDEPVEKKTFDTTGYTEFSYPDSINGEE